MVDGADVLGQVRQGAVHAIDQLGVGLVAVQAAEDGLEIRCFGDRAPIGLVQDALGEERGQEIHQVLAGAVVAEPVVGAQPDARRPVAVLGHAHGDGPGRSAQERADLQHVLPAAPETAEEVI